MVSRSNDEFRQNLYREMNNFVDMRTLSAKTLVRHVDAEAVNKCRVRTFHDQSRSIEHLTSRSEDGADMEKARATKGDYRMDPREFALSDNLALMYFNFYGHGFNNSPVVDNPDDGWTCPKCGLKYKMSLKLLPEYCRKCDTITPLGEMIRDKAFRR
jgi:hypothetical protein